MGAQPDDYYTEHNPAILEQLLVDYLNNVEISGIADGFFGADNKSNHTECENIETDVIRGSTAS